MNLKRIFQIILHASGLWVGLGAIAVPPNILIITADNLGYGDLQSYNAKSPIKSPSLDRLVGQGARLTGFYTASPTFD